MDWYYADASQNQQSVPEAELPGLVATGTIRPTTLVWNETMTNWQPAGQVKPDLFASLEVPPALAPMPGAGNGGEAASAAAAPSPMLTPSGGPYAAVAHPADGLAITSLVLGILSVLCLGPLTGIPAVICGHIARKKIRESTMPSTKGGLAMAGLVLGYVAIVVFLLYVAFVIVMGVLGETGALQ